MSDVDGQRRRIFAERLAGSGLSPPSAREDDYLWRIVDEGVLGASRHVKLSIELLAQILDGAEETWTGLQRARLAAEAIAATRGGDAPIIANTLAWIMNKLPDDPEAAAQLLRARLRDFEESAGRRREALVAAAAHKIGPEARVLAFDYSSTVAAIVHTLREDGQLAHLVIPESRCIAGGRRYLESFLPSGIDLMFLPDAAIDHAVALSECVLLGVESLHADGGFLNTVGSRPLAERAIGAGRRVFGATDMFKLDRRSYTGDEPPPRMRTFDETLLGGMDLPDKGASVTTRSPELERVPPAAYSALLTEHGPVPPPSVWSLGRELFGAATVDAP